MKNRLTGIEVLPKKKKGYAPVTNELLEALCAQPFTGSELKVILWGIRQILGWKDRRTSRQDNISLGQFSEKTGLSKQGVKNALKKLEKRRIFEVILKGSGKRSTLWYFNDNPESWLPLESTTDYSKHEKGGQPGCTLEVEKPAQKPVANANKRPGGNHSSSPGATRVAAKGGLESTTLAPQKRDLKETSQRERALAHLIQKTLTDCLEDSDFELNNGEKKVIEDVSKRYSAIEPEELGQGFRTYLGVQPQLDRKAILTWADVVSVTLPHSRDGKGMKRINVKTAI